MASLSRKPYQGVMNIVRFNWQFYLFAVAGILLIYFFTLVSNNFRSGWMQVFLALPLMGIVFSLAVSFYVYDCSGFYSLKWLDELRLPPRAIIVNVHAGLDETSSLISVRYPDAELRVLDFYDPKRHSEVSIRRARKIYPPLPGTTSIQTGQSHLASGLVDVFFLILAAHEIRQREERVVFFKELHRALKQEGRVVVTEHLRDLPNFLAYTVGFLHFYSSGEWKRNFSSAGFMIEKQEKINPFITQFVLIKNGTAS